VDEIEAISFILSIRAAVDGRIDGGSTGISGCGGSCTALGFVEDSLGSGNGGGFDFCDGVGGHTECVHVVAWVSRVVRFVENAMHPCDKSGGVLVVVLASSGSREHEFDDACPDMLLHGCACCEAGICHGWFFFKLDNCKRVTIDMIIMVNSVI
jgi:hypothetical protein